MISALQHLAADLTGSPSTLQPARLLGTRARSAMPMRLGNKVFPPRLARYPQFENPSLPPLKYGEGLMKGENHDLVADLIHSCYDLVISGNVVGVCDYGEPYKGIEIINIGLLMKGLPHILPGIGDAAIKEQISAHFFNGMPFEDAIQDIDLVNAGMKKLDEESRARKRVVKGLAFTGVAIEVAEDEVCEGKLPTPVDGYKEAVARRIKGPNNAPYSHLTPGTTLQAACFYHPCAVERALDWKKYIETELGLFPKRCCAKFVTACTNIANGLPRNCLLPTHLSTLVLAAKLRMAGVEPAHMEVAVRSKTARRLLGEFDLLKGAVIAVMKAMPEYILLAGKDLAPNLEGMETCVRGHALDKIKMGLAGDGAEEIAAHEYYTTIFRDLMFAITANVQLDMADFNSAGALALYGIYGRGLAMCFGKVGLRFRSGMCLGAGYTDAFRAQYLLYVLIALTLREIKVPGW